MKPQPTQQTQYTTGLIPTTWWAKAITVYILLTTLTVASFIIASALR